MGLHQPFLFNHMASADVRRPCGEFAKRQGIIYFALAEHRKLNYSLWLTITVVPVLTMPLFTTIKVKILFRRKPSGMVANAEREHRMRLRLKGGFA